jgi:threonine dehydrogenase-like Zn-dependent dehydrogenase
MKSEASGAMMLDFKKDGICGQQLTNGRGADACIDAVGTGPDIGSVFDVATSVTPWRAF